jgi:hypothetical protein
MKKLSISMCAALLMSMFCAACDKHKQHDEVDIEKPAVASAEVTAFFKEHTYDLILGNNTPTCVLINSTNDFTKILPPSTTLPAIDFDKYTLVVGRYEKSGEQTLIDQSIYMRPTTMTVNLVLGPCNGLTVIHKAIYWDIYPKLPQKTISIQRNIIRNF